MSVYHDGQEPLNTSSQIVVVADSPWRGYISIGYIMQNGLTNWFCGHLVLSKS